MLSPSTLAGSHKRRLSPKPKTHRSICQCPAGLMQPPRSTQEAINRFAKEFKKLSQTAPKGAPQTDFARALGRKTISPILPNTFFCGVRISAACRCHCFRLDRNYSSCQTTRAPNNPNTHTNRTPLSPRPKDQRERNVKWQQLFKSGAPKAVTFCCEP